MQELIAEHMGFLVHPIKEEVVAPAQPTSRTRSRTNRGTKWECRRASVDEGNLRERVMGDRMRDSTLCR